jgi:uncharacterized protein YhbP (UPF0306 family)
MTDEAVSRIRAYLEQRTTLSLATSGSSGVWAASMFFASDEDLSLYFVSDSKTRHCQDLTSNPDVVVTINEDVKDWAAIEGLQITARAAVVDEKDRPAVQELFLTKFPAVRALFDAPKSDDEQEIADRLGGSRFYRIVPNWIRFIDNSRGFGFREEVSLGEARNRD